jgi:hypothetical protein
VIETESNILASPKEIKELEIFLDDLKDMRNTIEIFSNHKKSLRKARDISPF